MATKRYPKLEREAADPTTSPDRLRSLVSRNESSVSNLAKSNPNLPSDLLKDLLERGDPHAWVNPSTLLLLFSGEYSNTRGARWALEQHILNQNVAVAVTLPGLWEAISPVCEQLASEQNVGHLFRLDTINRLRSIETYSYAMKGDRYGKILNEVAIDVLRSVGCEDVSFADRVHKALDFLDVALHSDITSEKENALWKARQLLAGASGRPARGSSNESTPCKSLAEGMQMMCESDMRKPREAINRVDVSSIMSVTGVPMYERVNQIVDDRLPWAFLHDAIVDHMRRIDSSKR